MKPACILLVVGLPLCAEQAGAPAAPLAPGLVLLSRAQRTVAEMLRRMPNFTCVETIERSRREPPLKRFRLLDTLRLEVALVEGRELFAWPGATKFEDRDLRDMVGGSGATGTGDFALHAKSIFLTGTARFDYLGEEAIEGRRTHKFHYTVPRSSSSFMMRVGQAQGFVGYQGSVWHDADSMELARMVLDIDDIPSSVPLSEGHKRIDYAPVRIGEETFTLPTMVDMQLSALDGTESRNRAVFSACRQYTGASTLRFDDPPADQPAAPAPVTITLPAGVSVAMKLVSTLDLAKVAVGDPVVFEVSKDATRGGVVLLPRGTRVQMRLDLLVCRDWSPPHCFVALVPVSFQFQNKNGLFRAELEFPSLERVMALTFSNLRPELRFIPAALGQASSGAAFLLARGTRGKLPSGYATTWRTLEARGEDKP